MGRTNYSSTPQRDRHTFCEVLGILSTWIYSFFSEVIYRLPPNRVMPERHFVLTRSLFKFGLSGYAQAQRLTQVYERLDKPT